MNTATALTSIPQTVVLGFNHHTAGVDLRDRVYYATEDIPDVLQQIVMQGAKEVVLVSTCNRTEVYALFDKQLDGKEILKQFFKTHKNLSDQELTEHSYCYEASQAYVHLFRVVASLDSMVVGENQILGQVKTAYGLARDQGTVQFFFNHIFQAAFHSAKRVRSETSINEGAVSISYAAVELARKVLGSLENKVVGVVGSGEMGELTASHLARCHIKNFVFFNRTASRAEPLLARFGGNFCPLDQMENELHVCDIVVSATGARGLVIRHAHVARAVRARGGDPLFLIDIAAPRDIEESVGTLDNVFLFTIDDLKKVAEENRDARSLESLAAQAIIDEELQNLDVWMNQLDLVGSIRLLREKYQEILETETKRVLSQQTWDAEALQQFSHRLMEKFLHAPLTGLKKLGEIEGGHKAGEIAGILFGIKGSRPEPPK